MIRIRRYRMTVTKRGSSAKPFGWEILRADDDVEVERSSDTFRSRSEATVQGEPAAAAWERRSPESRIGASPKR
jgi:hypothetical protein